MDPVPWYDNPREHPSGNTHPGSLSAAGVAKPTPGSFLTQFPTHAPFTVHKVPPLGKSLLTLTSPLTEGAERCHCTVRGVHHSTAYVHGGIGLLPPPSRAAGSLGPGCALTHLRMPRACPGACQQGNNP